MCTNGTQVPCEVPSLPSPTTRKGWPHHRGIRPLLFSNNDVGSFTFHKNKSVKVLCDGTYGLSSLSEKTRKSNHLQMCKYWKYCIASNHSPWFWRSPNGIAKPFDFPTRNCGFPPVMWFLELACFTIKVIKRWAVKTNDAFQMLYYIYYAAYF